MLKKVIAVYSCIVDDVPMLEDEIGSFICHHMIKNKINLDQLQFDQIKDDDHKDLSKVSYIFLNIVKIGIEYNEDRPENSLYLY